MVRRIGCQSRSLGSKPEAFGAQEELMNPERVDQDVLDDLRRRLRATRRVPLVEGVGWDRGTDPDYLADLVADWADRYDWRPHEERLLALPWVSTGRGDTGLRAVHQPSSPDAPTVVLLHGWPDSFLRFDRALPLLKELNVVVPCLPGYPVRLPAHPARHVDQRHGRGGGGGDGRAGLRPLRRLRWGRGQLGGRASGRGAPGAGGGAAPDRHSVQPSVHRRSERADRARERLPGGRSAAGR